MDTPRLSSSSSHALSSSAAAVTVAPTREGCCVRVTGRGTVRESAAARDVATRTLDAEGADAVVVFDLSDCDYLDSTFLGCLTGLFQAAGRSKPPRFLVAGPADVRKKLMGACRLDKLLPSIETAPQVVGPFVDVPAVDDSDPIEIARHVMACHRALAAVDGPMRVAFTRIADQLEKELAAAEAPAGAGK
jgi:anti-anti-sigma regulatory factor